jgi:hypothetical protein
MSKFINEKMTDKLNFVVGNKATILVKTIARIFTASPEDNWKDSGLLGFLCLVFDRSTKSPYFRLFEIDTCELTFEMELYYNFADSYKNLNGFFYYFEVKNGFIGNILIFLLMEFHR